MYLSSGNKMNNIEVVYTMWDNLKKTGSMDVGQVGFHKHKEVCDLLWIVQIKDSANVLKFWTLYSIFFFA